MTASNVLLASALASVAWGIVSSMVIVSSLQKRGIRINFLLLRILVIKYVGHYRDITREETGKTGPWYYSFASSMCLALVLATIGLALRFA